MESDMIGKNYRCWVRKEKGRGGGFPKGEGRMGGGGVCKVYLLTYYLQVPLLECSQYVQVTLLARDF